MSFKRAHERGRGGKIVWALRERMREGEGERLYGL